MADKLYISQIALPDGNTYELKDLEARGLIADLAAGSLAFVKSTAAADTPYGVTWNNGTSDITGTLVASADTKGKIYLVPTTNGAGKDIHAEYVTIISGGTTQNPTFAWEKLGDTEMDFSSLGALAYKDSVTLNKGSGDTVLGEATTFTAAASAVTFTGSSSDDFVKSYPGSTQKLATTSVKGVGSDITFNAVASDPGTVTASHIVFGTDTTASKVTTTEKTATNTVLGTATKASKATAGTAVSLAKAASAATPISYVGSANTSSVLETASVTGEVLSFGTVAVSQGSVTGTNGTESITPYTFADVTVPVISSNTAVTFDAVGSATDVTVPVVSSDTEVTAAGQITLASKTAATAASNATVVATGKVAASDSNGDDVLVGLGTATTGSAVTSVGTGEAAAQTITVGTNDKVSVAKLGDLSVTVA